MDKRRLDFPSGYDRDGQAIVGLFAAQLDDQLELLKEAVSGLTIEQMEWQPHRGMNTIGMLMAHLAVVEVFWINVAAKEMPPEPDGDELMKKTIGILMDDDGLPIKPDGVHPQTLAGKTVADYFHMLDLARASVHSELRTWKDSELESTYTRRRGDQERKITNSWTLYHVLEHFAAHFGQILLIMHLMRDAGKLEASKRP